MLWRVNYKQKQDQKKKDIGNEKEAEMLSFQVSLAVGRLFGRSVGRSPGQCRCALSKPVRESHRHGC